MLSYLYTFYFQVNTVGSYFNTCMYLNCCFCLWYCDLMKRLFVSGGRLNAQFGESGKKLKLETVFPIFKWSCSDDDNFYKKVRTPWTRIPSRSRGSLMTESDTSTKWGDHVRDRVSFSFQWDCGYWARSRWCYCSRSSSVRERETS